MRAESYETISEFPDKTEIMINTLEVGLDDFAGNRMKLNYSIDKPYKKAYDYIPDIPESTVAKMVAHNFTLTASDIPRNWKYHMGMAKTRIRHKHLAHLDIKADQLPDAKFEKYPYSISTDTRKSLFEALLVSVPISTGMVLAYHYMSESEFKGLYSAAAVFATYALAYMIFTLAHASVERKFETDKDEKFLMLMRALEHISNLYHRNDQWCQNKPHVRKPRKSLCELQQQEIDYYMELELYLTKLEIWGEVVETLLAGQEPIMLDPVAIDEKHRLREMPTHLIMDKYALSLTSSDDNQYISSVRNKK